MTAVLRGKHLAVAITEALRSNKLVVAKSGRDNIIKQQTLKTVEKIKEKPWSALTGVEIMCDYINAMAVGDCILIVPKYAIYRPASPLPACAGPLQPAVIWYIETV